MDSSVPTNASHRMPCRDIWGVFSLLSLSLMFLPRPTYVKCIYKGDRDLKVQIERKVNLIV